MFTRITAGAFLTCQNKVLMMKRGLHKSLAPGLWAGIGGHMDIEDIKDTRALNLAETCYREVFEETGIVKHDIRNLKLRYITIRNVGKEIRYHYHYIGETERELTLPECDEGELHWVDRDEILDLPMTLSVKQPLKHWIANLKNSNNNDNESVFLVIVNSAGDNAEILRL